ncbi:AraC-type DNA-binding protein [Chitinophaga costaii]|uniref:AraC-type DNA-binding protein n=1 Tax=Chitinophaga costaii TaxID=1335309 RepID=A0A1C4CRC5_9BACT|nr:AraC family transcriptional regulator [Chitinophaga costaii]PUZ26984.1 AraC family transcriptional regulator [Chitinophaga costaii]SCC21654.1 AraC-type DNA-binding protein [Chitinophaga costaii]
MLLPLTYGGKGIHYEDVLPPHCERYRIAHTTLNAAQLDGLTILIQTARLPHSQITLTHLLATAPHELAFNTSKQSAVMFFALKGKLDLHGSDGATLHLQHAHYNIFRMDRSNGHVLLSRGKHILLTIAFDKQYLPQYAANFPRLQHFQDAGTVGWLPLYAQHRAIGLDMQRTIGSLRHCALDGAARDYFMEAKVVELLMTALYETPDKVTPRQIMMLKKKDQEILANARNLLLKNIDEHISTLELARRIGMNDFKLKRGFKQLFGTTIFEFVSTARMEEAKRLLRETDLPIKSIAAGAGYKNMSNFIAAFKRRNGLPPGDFKRKSFQRMLLGA